MDGNRTSRWRPGWTLLILMIFVALTVSDEAARLTSDAPVQFTWNQSLLGAIDQGGPEPEDAEFASLLANDVQELAAVLSSDSGPAVSLGEIDILPAGDGETSEELPVDAVTLAAGVEANAQQAEQAAEEAPEPEKPAVLTHVVARGQTLWDIAKIYGIHIDTIVAANGISDPQRLQVGQELTILSIDGALHTVRTGDSVWSIARAYQVKTQDIVEANNLSDPSSLKVGQQLLIPGAQAVAAQRYQLIGPNGQLRRAFDWPARARISSRFGSRWGSMHYGLDIAIPIGTPVRAAADGRVTWSGARGSYGNLVIIDHGQKVETRYAHNSRLAVKAGDTVKRGQIIAYSGNTGRSTGPHLHFEIRYRGTAVNPEKYLVP
ncbi:MAG: M23 family metallopeptidase [Firmicutes bacterium]|nr:M23 family metallopeptidase [Bacillota bacterium]